MILVVVPDVMFGVARKVVSKVAAFVVPMVVPKEVSKVAAFVVPMVVPKEAEQS